MKLDASKEFELFSKIVTNIKMQANLIGDSDVLISLTETLASLLIGMYATIPQDVESPHLQTLLEQRYDEILAVNQLKKVTLP